MAADADRCQPVGVRLLRISEVAAALGVHKETVLRWIRRSQIPYVRINSRTYRIRSDDIERIIASQKR